MSDLISRQDLLKLFENLRDEHETNAISYVALYEVILQQPTIEAAPVVHSEWKYYRKKCIAVCKNCSFERNLNENFGMAIACPNCGADMRKGGTP